VREREEKKESERERETARESERESASEREGEREMSTPDIKTKKYKRCPSLRVISVNLWK
jgi:hypothetical protein